MHKRAPSLSGLALATLLAGCSSQKAPPPVAPAGPAASGTVDIAGGTVTGPDGASVEVPAGATSSPVTIGIQRVASGQPQGPLPRIGEVYVLTPHDTPFEKPVTVRIPVDPAQVPAGSQLALAKVSPLGQWTLFLGARYEGGFLVQEVRDFSAFVPTAIPPPPPGSGPFRADITPSHPERFTGYTVIGPPPAGVRRTDYEASVDRPMRIEGQIAVPYLPGVWCATTANAAVQLVGGAGATIGATGPFTPSQLSVTFAVDAIEKSAGIQSLIATFDCFSPVPAPRHLTCPRSELMASFGIIGAECADPHAILGSCSPIPGTQTFDCIAQDPPVRTAVQANNAMVVRYSGPRASLGILAFFAGHYVDPWSGILHHDRAVPVLRGPFLEGSPLEFGAMLVGGATAAAEPLGGVICDPIVSGCSYRLPPDHVGVELQRSRDGGATWSTVDVLREADRHSDDFRFFARGPGPDPSSYEESWFQNRFDWAQLGSAPYTWPYGPARHVPPGLLFNLTDVVADLADDGTSWRIRASRTDPTTGVVDSVVSDPVVVGITPRNIAPAFTSVPQDLMVTAPGEAVFTATATGRPAPEYQWQSAPPFGSTAWTSIPGAVGPTFRIPALLADNGRRIRVIARNAVGQVTSNPVELLVTPADVAPTIQVEPVAAEVEAGQVARFAVAARGTDPLAYAWYREGAPISLLDNPTALSPELTLLPTLADAGSRYRVRVFNTAGEVTSAEVVLTVTTGAGPAVPPIIDVQPLGLAVPAGAPATLGVQASGTGPLTYQWSHDLVPIPGAVSAVLAIPAASPSEAGSYTVTVTGAIAPAATSVPATLVVLSPPAITTQPQSATVGLANPATFSVTASGPALSYQWMRNGVVIAGARGASYASPPVVLAESGTTFSVLVWNPAGQVLSDGAVLTVINAPPVVTSPLAPATVPENTPVTFTVGATGGPPPGFAWTLDGVAIPGCAAPSCSFTPAWSDGGKAVRVVAGNGVPPDAASSAVLTVTVADIPPVVTQQPRSAGVVEPDTATFSVVATGSPAPAYQWLSSDDAGASWTPVAGATGASYTTPPTQGAWNGRRYRAEVTNAVRTPPATTAVHTVTSAAARLDVMAASPANALLARAIAVGHQRSFAVAIDGTVWAWGESVDAATGQHSEASTQAAPWASSPVQVQAAAGTPLSGVLSIAVARGATSNGSTHALHADGTVSAWGSNGAGQLGDGTTTTRAAPVKVMDGLAPLDRGCAVASANDVLIVVRSDEPDGACGPGKAKRAWVAGLLSGSSAGGLPPAGTSGNGAVIRPVPGLPAGVPVARAVGLGTYSTSGALLFLLENGQVFAWGWNFDNMLGAGEGNSTAGLTGTIQPVEVTSFWSDALDITLGWNLGVARTGSGALQAVGRNWEGQLGDGSPDTVLARPTLGSVSTATSVSSVSAGHRTVLALQDGQVWGWGYGWELLGPTPSPFIARTPLRIGTGLGFTQVAAGYGHALLLGPGGAVYAWGAAAFGALGNGTTGGIVAEPAVVTR